MNLMNHFFFSFFFPYTHNGVTDRKQMNVKINAGITKVKILDAISLLERFLFYNDGF